MATQGLMTFQSPFFFIFFVITIGIYFLVRKENRWIPLLLASLLFYYMNGSLVLVVVLLGVILISYSIGISIAAVSPGSRKTTLFVMGLVLNVGILLVVKLIPVLRGSGILLSDAQQSFSTIGVSFYVFQSVSYLIDIYLEKIDPERHIGYFALYIAFFPKVLQGPIERGKDLLPQLRRLDDFSYENARVGTLRFTYGLFKKLVIADRIGAMVDTVYSQPSEVSGFLLLFATILYSFQLYYDFSGYTDMAIGIARVFNIRLVENFNLPYLSTSVSEFWRRWHMSFSRWIMDYLFKPIQLSLRRWGTWGGAIALLITFFISGLWHGISWTFVIWGGLHGVYLVTDMVTARLRKKWAKSKQLKFPRLATIGQVILTFSLITFAWIFFRSDSLSDALIIIRKIFTPIELLPPAYRICGRALLENFSFPAISGVLQSDICQIPTQELSFYPGVLQNLNYAIAVILLPMAYLMSKFWPRLYSANLSPWKRWCVYSVVVLVIFLSQLFLPVSGTQSSPYLYGAF